jgi:hypothetical protein
LGETRLFLTPSSASTLLSSSLSLRSRTSHSDASLCASSSAAGFGTLLPTSVVEKKSSTARIGEVIPDLEPVSALPGRTVDGRPGHVMIIRLINYFLGTTTLPN